MTVAVLVDQYQKDLGLSLAHCFKPKAEVVVLDKEEAMQALRDYQQNDLPFAVELDNDEVVTP